MWGSDQPVGMSADRRAPVGLDHMTVVPENFEPSAERDADDPRDGRTET